MTAALRAREAAFYHAFFLSARLPSVALFQHRLQLSYFGFAAAGLEQAAALGPVYAASAYQRRFDVGYELDCGKLRDQLADDGKQPAGHEVC